MGREKIGMSPQDRSLLDVNPFLFLPTSSGDSSKTVFFFFFLKQQHEKRTASLHCNILVLRIRKGEGDFAA